MSKDYVGYIEGMDLSKIEPNYLAFPSKNVIIHKGIAYTRNGIKNDANVPVSTNNKVIGEYVWKDALGGEKALRALKDGTIQVKWVGLWIKIGMVTPNSEHVRFATWTDDSEDIIKNRLFAVDGTDKIFEWNGAIGTILSVNAGAQTVTLASGGTGEKLGFDPGNSSAQPLQIVRFSSGAVEDITQYTTDSDMTGLTLHTVGGISVVPTAGDIVVGGWITHTDVLAGIIKDDVYNYYNHLALASLSSITVYFSDSEAKLSYVFPAPSDRVYTSPFFINLVGNYTAMISRFNQSTQVSILWISDADGWTKVTVLDTQDSFGDFVVSNRFAESDSTGALPFAVADYNGDIVFMRQDNTIQDITTIDVLSKDSFKLFSDEIETLLQRLDNTGVRLLYLTRYLYLIFPAESTIVMLDLVEGHWQTPQTIPCAFLSVIAGTLYGHSNVRDETFYMFVGHDDLGSDIESVFAFGYYQGYQRVSRTTHVTQDFFLKQHTKMGVSGRMTASTIATVQQFFENDGAKASDVFDIDGSEVTLYSLPDDESWATHMWGDASIGGSDDPADALGRFYAWEAYNAVAYFEYRPIITVNGKQQQFQLIGWYINDTLSNKTIPDNLWISK